MDPGLFLERHPGVYKVSMVLAAGVAMFAAVRAVMDRADRRKMARDAALALVTAGEVIGMTRMKSHGHRQAEAMAA
jgi:Na+-translocating ferredoxin:NAD+ oxidoreductase RnfA subunit